MGAGDEPGSAIETSRARAGHEEPDAIVTAYLVSGDSGVVDMADDVVAVEGLRGGTGSDFEDGGIV